MPLEQVKLDAPVDVRAILSSSNVPLRTNSGAALSVDQLLAATPMERRTGAQIARANMMDNAIRSAQENQNVLIQVPLETERIIGLYFSAHWCPPCRNFTPQLASTYSELRKQNRDFEIVFCSWDNKPEEYLAYAQQMPWPRLPFRDPRINELARGFGVKSVPTLVLVRASDNGLITKSARMHVPYDVNGKNFPWYGGQLGWFGSVWHALPMSGKIGLVGVFGWLTWQVVSRTGLRTALFKR